LQRPLERSAFHRLPPAAAVGAEIGSSAGEPARFVELDPTVRRPNHPHQVALLACRPARHACPCRVVFRARRGWAAAYEDTSAAFLRVVFFGVAPFASTSTAVPLRSAAVGAAASAGA